MKLLVPFSCQNRKISKHFPRLSLLCLGLLFMGCLFAGILSSKDPTYLDITHRDTAPCPEFWFGTDGMGRDLFAAIWHGGRVSLSIGFLSMLISTAIAVCYGTVSALSSPVLDRLLMRGCELFLSIPSILVTVFVQAIIGAAGAFSLALVIGLTGWMGMAKIVRSQVQLLRRSGFILASQTMHAGFWYQMRRHYLPNLFPAILFMMVNQIGSAIAMESTLSFLGLGLPLDTISWGSLLSQADQALLSGSWWMIFFPGVFLAITLITITDLGNYLRKGGAQL